MQEEKPMTVRTLRLEKGWSQEDLAQMSGLSVRTIQRIEQGKKAGLESMKCLAAVFETDVANLIQENTMANDIDKTALRREEAEAYDYVQNLKGFHLNWICYLIVIPGLYLLNIYVTPDELWVIYPAIAWLFAIGLHAAVIFGLFHVFGNRWEQKHMDRYMDRRE